MQNPEKPRYDMTAAQLMKCSAEELMDYVYKLYQANEYDKLINIYEKFDLKVYDQIPSAKPILVLFNIIAAVYFKKRDYSNASFIAHRFCENITDRKYTVGDEFFAKLPLNRAEEIFVNSFPQSYILSVNNLPKIVDRGLGLNLNFLFSLSSKFMIDYFLQDLAIVNALDSYGGYALEARCNSNYADGCYHCFLVGYLYEKGNKQLEFEIDPQKAKAYYAMAVAHRDASQIHPEAACIIAMDKLSEFEENGDDNHYKEAMRLLTAAKQLKNPQADILLADACARKLKYLKNNMVDQTHAEKSAQNMNKADKEKITPDKEEDEIKILREAEINHLHDALDMPIKFVHVEAYERLYFIAVEEQDNASAQECLKMLEKYGHTIGSGFTATPTQPVNPAKTSLGITSQWQQNNVEVRGDVEQAAEQRHQETSDDKNKVAENLDESQSPRKP